MMESPKPGAKAPTVTDWFRVTFKGVVDPIADFFNRLGVHQLHDRRRAGAQCHRRGFHRPGLDDARRGVHPDRQPFDALDGTMARRLNQPTRFGAFVDSITDRWSELLILFGLAYYYVNSSDPSGPVNVLLVFLAIMGSVMVSYTKSRAESLGFTANVGVMTRLERYLIMAPCLLFNVPWVAIWILAIFANFTALQRTWHVRKQAYSKPED